MREPWPAQERLTFMTTWIDENGEFGSQSFQAEENLNVWGQAARHAYNKYKPAADAVEKLYARSVHKLPYAIRGFTNDQRRVDEREENEEYLAFLKQWENELEGTSDRNWLRNIINSAVKMRVLYEMELRMLNAKLEQSERESEKE